MNTIKKNTLEKNLFYDNQIILKYKIEYPEITESKYSEGAKIFNQKNQKEALKLKQYAETDLYEEAKEIYEYNKKNGYPIMVYEVIQVFEITYNIQNIISMYKDQYIYSGGAHGITTRIPLNWNLEVCKEIPLFCCYPNNPYFILDILKQILNEIQEQIATEGNIYFDNYCNLVIQTFNPNQFYIVPQGIIIFFNLYDIAPYSTGIPTFLIEKQK